MKSVGSSVDTSQVQSWIAALNRPTRRSTILVMDDDEGLAAVRVPLAGEGYRILSCHNADAALDILHRLPVDLLILEARDFRAADFCRRLRANRQTELIPVLMVCEVQTPGLELDCIGSGADI